MKKYEISKTEVSEKAFRVYSDSDFTFYKKDDTFYVADNPKDTHYQEVGSLKDVEEWLEGWADED